MRVFKTECKDSKTGYSMILSECSYNVAMDWLSRELAKYGGEIYRTEMHTDGLMYIWTGECSPTDCISSRMFFYDEERGYLLGE